MSPRPPPKISLRHDHDWTRGSDQLGSTVEQQPVGKIVRQSQGELQHATFSQLTQPIPKPICDRSGKPDSTEDVFVVTGETSRSHEIDEKGFHGELGSSDRSGKPDNLSENTRVVVIEVFVFMETRYVPLVLTISYDLIQMVGHVGTWACSSTCQTRFTSDRRNCVAHTTVRKVVLNLQPPS